MTIQDRLNEAYRQLVDRTAVLESLAKCQSPELCLKELNGPFLVAADDQYLSSSPKVAIVGQENNGWLEFDYSTFLSCHAIEDALSVYRGFNIADYGPGFFGRYVLAFRDRLLGPACDTNRRAVLYNNLFKLNHDGGHSISSPHLAAMLELQRGVFALEMEILAPDVLIFLTGPDYDFVIKHFYPDATFQQVESHPLNELAQVSAAGLPGLSFRTYHPGYLNYVVAKKPHCVEAIVERVKRCFP